MTAPRMLAAPALAGLLLLSCARSTGAPAASPAAPAAPAAAPAAAATSIPEELFTKAGFETPSREIAAVDFALESLDGTRVSLSSFRGSVVVLSFWATWCPPCREEMPAMEKLYRDLQAKGVVILAVDSREDRATVKDFVEKNRYTFPVLLDPSGSAGGSYGVEALPTNFLVDRSGRVVARIVGIGGPGWASRETRALFDALLAS